MSEASKHYRLQITADAEPLVLARVADILATFSMVPSRFACQVLEEPSLLVIHIEAAMGVHRSDLLRRQLLRLTETHSVEVSGS